MLENLTEALQRISRYEESTWIQRRTGEVPELSQKDQALREALSNYVEIMVRWAEREHTDDEQDGRFD